MIETKVLKTITKYNLIEDGDHVVLGLSGGPDSMCLLHVLNDLRSEIDFDITAVHVNHMLRANSADRDEAFAAQVCQQLGIDFRSFRIDCNALAEAEDLTSEEAGRKARYGAFRQVADTLADLPKSRRSIPPEHAYSNVKIAVAHNADDQAETLLFRILRGTGTDGLAGMEHLRMEGEHAVIRPLLHVTRTEIANYLHVKGIEYVTDETNEQPVYTRNKLRLEVIPYIKENYNDNIIAALDRLADIAAVDKDYIWQQSEEAYVSCVVSENDSCVVLDQDQVSRLHEAIRHRVIMRALRSVGMWEDVTHERLLAADDMLHSDTSTKVIEMPHGYKITFAFGEIRVKAPELKTEFNPESVQVELVEDPEQIETLRFDLTAQGYSDGVLWMDADKLAHVSGIDKSALANAVELRSRREGDYIVLRSGTKKLKKLLGEMKIPADERDDARIIAAGPCVLMVQSSDGNNKRFAETLRVDDKTQAVLIVKVV